MKRTAFAFAATLAAGAASAATTPENAGRAPANGATISGGGDNTTIDYDLRGVLSQPGRFASFAGSRGDGPVVEYSGPAPAGAAGGEAWMEGGGDNVRLTYAPRG